MTDSLSDYGITEVVEPESATATVEEPEVTNEIAAAVVAEFVDIEAANGFVTIGQNHGITTSQVKDLYDLYCAELSTEDSEA